MSFRQCRHAGCPRPAAQGRTECYPCYGARRRGIPLKAVRNDPTGIPVEELGPVQPGLGFLRSVAWDLETTDLHALMGRILCCSFYDMETGETWTLRLDEAPFAVPGNPIDDSRLAVAIRDTLEQYDVLISYNGILFDHKMLKARLLKAGERMPEPRWVVDPMWNVRSNFKMSSKLANVTKFVGGEEKPAPTWEEWQGAAAGHRPSMDIIAERCEADCRILADVARRIKPCIKQLQRKG